MSGPIERPAALEFDFDQWRTDIQTFAKETQHELHSIIADLSGRESSSPTRSVATEPAAVESPPNQRLASLKEKLAKRLNQPKT